MGIDIIALGLSNELLLPHIFFVCALLIRNFKNLKLLFIRLMDFMGNDKQFLLAK